MTEHYPADILARTRALYQDVQEWAAGRGDVTIIGGWAVHHHVEPHRAMQSRDVDLVLHSEDALRKLLQELPRWDLRLRRTGRKTFPDAHFKDEDPLVFRLDLFTTATNDTWMRVFGRQGVANVKQAPKRLYPDLVWTLRDKLTTVPLRHGQEAEDKRAKDLIDAYHLVFHNTKGMTARDLLPRVPAAVRHTALGFLGEAQRTRPEYHDDLSVLRRWLEG